MTHAPVPPIHLASGTSLCTIHPGMGGSIGDWTVDGQPMMRTASAPDVAARDAFGMGSFPLVPYSNRIGRGQFDWNGQAHRLTPNFAPETHAIHGIGFDRAWAVDNLTAAGVTLSLDHPGGADWPWPFSAEQIVSVSGDSLSIIMRARSHAAIPVPLAFGHHPYFDRAGAQLGFQAERVWMSDRNGLPTHAIAPIANFDFSCITDVADHDVDHCFTGWTGPAQIRWKGRALGLDITASPSLAAAVVYIPPGGTTFCFEPVPHVNNALNMPGVEPAMPIIAPGAQFEAHINFRSVPL
jgi:aldose 1-epimerase